MSSLLQQLPTLLGVVIGSLATYAVTMSAERSRWRRGLAVRWDERRLATYMEYAHAVKKVISVATRLAAQRGVFVGGDGTTEVYRVTDLADAEEQRTIDWEAVLMLGSDDVVIAARQWHDCVFRLQRIAADQATDMSWRDAVDGTSLARRRFYEAARRDLGVALSRSPEAYEWQFSKWMTESSTAPDAQTAIPKPAAPDAATSTLIDE
jgi:hypothetical protein